MRYRLNATCRVRIGQSPRPWISTFPNYKHMAVFEFRTSPHFFFRLCGLTQILIWNSSLLASTLVTFQLFLKSLANREFGFRKQSGWHFDEFPNSFLLHFSLVSFRTLFASLSLPPCSTCSGLGFHEFFAATLNDEVLSDLRMLSLASTDCANWQKKINS